MLHKNAFDLNCCDVFSRSANDVFLAINELETSISISSYNVTGDIVTRDADGRFKFVDRKKNVIRRSGENIAAVEVESVLMQHESVRAAGVTPVPDALRGDEVFACLVVDSPSSKLAHDIATWALSQMAYYKVPGYIAFVDTLPLTSTQKIQRKILKEKAATLILDPQTICLTSLKKRQVA